MCEGRKKKKHQKTSLKVLDVYSSGMNDEVNHTRKNRNNTKSGKRKGVLSNH